MSYYKNIYSEITTLKKINDVLASIVGCISISSGYSILANKMFLTRKS